MMARNAPISYFVVLLVAVACGGLVKFGWLNGPVDMAANIALFGYSEYGFLNSLKS